MADHAFREGSKDKEDAAVVCWNFPEIRVLRDGERAALRAGLRERDEKTREEDAVPPREAAIEPVYRVRGGEIPGVQQVQTLRRQSAVNLKPEDHEEASSIELMDSSRGFDDERS